MTTVWRQSAAEHQYHQKTQPTEEASSLEDGQLMRRNGVSSVIFISLLTKKMT